MLPLDGIKVLDLSIMYAGPGTTMYLGDMGADVVKVEQLTGDDSRMLGTSAYLGKNSRFYMAVNRNKRALSLDLGVPAGKEIIRRLASDADVILHNFRPGVAERLGVDHATLSAANPRLIYVWLTGFGPRGPYADKQAYDNVIQGYSGVYDARMRRYGDPSGAGTFVADTAAPMLLGFAIGAALWKRGLTGRGQLIEGSLLAVALSSQATQWVKAPVDADGDPEPETPDDYCLVLACQDGEHLTIATVTDDEWRRLCGVLAMPGLATDDQFATTEARGRHHAALAALIEERFRESDRDRWIELLLAAGVPCAPVIMRADMKDFQQAVDNDIFVRVEHPVAGSTVLFDVPVRLSETPGTIRMPAPVFGQDTDTILGEIGYAAAEIEQLRADRVVA